MSKVAEEFTIRFNKALSIRNMKPSELSEKTGISKSTISHYMSGYTKPKSDKLFILANALDVAEAWLMGLDVAMERNDYEDQNIARFDAELEHAWEIIESAGYSLSFSEAPNDDILTIRNKSNEIIACMHDYELINKYESLQRKGLVNAELLLKDKEVQYIIDKVFAFDCQLKALGWTYKIITEPASALNEKPKTYAVFKNEDISFKASLEDCDIFINDAELFYKERMQLLLKKSMKQMFTEGIGGKPHLIPNAAHERTDIEVTEEMKKHDDAFFEE